MTGLLVILVMCSRTLLERLLLFLLCMILETKGLKMCPCRELWSGALLPHETFLFMAIHCRRSGLCVMPVCLHELPSRKDTTVCLRALTVLLGESST